MNGALICDFQQPGFLFGRQRPSQMDVAFNSIQHHVFGFAIDAIGSVDLRMPQIDGDVLERPSFAPSVHSESDRRARAQRGEKKIVGRWSCVCHLQMQVRRILDDAGPQKFPAQIRRRCLERRHLERYSLKWSPPLHDATHSSKPPSTISRQSTLVVG